ncbi:triose-phosphate isomerase [Sphaceloma murrayae]|uniref:Triosephosphate isomerase n=1 Tax=Sphaceloma murrayae TaxID=2082308 RepID=A0A2K1QMN7_9PEZI|nr:triose-phosphate isomerase [Sphaceloma murrayae]
MPASVPSRRRIVGTSLKMYFDLPGTLEYVKAVAELTAVASKHNIDLFVIPDFVSLLPSRDLLKDTDVKLGAQDCFWEAKGAYTGEVSPLSLAQAGVEIVEIGHAERRRLFHETDAEVAKKAAAIVASGMVPLVCIGEKTHSQVAGQAVGTAVSECTPQVQAVLKSIPDEAEVVFAYEPVWAIGAAQPAPGDHVVAVTRQLRTLLDGRKGLSRILYGGSAGPGTFLSLKDGVDGLFLGRFAHDVGNLDKVIREMAL